jgi:single-stranded-DNA-specific exonuclease
MMVSQRFSWKEPDPVPSQIKEELVSFTPAFQSLLYQRGFKSVQDAVSFLTAAEKPWYKNLKLRHLDKACHLISRYVADEQPIAVFGDFDADGITSTALVTHALSKITGNVITRIPSRLDEGYGLNNDTIDELHQLGVRLIITVDNGIRSFSEISHANELGMQVIITDHHQPESALPPAAAVINPKLPDEVYPFKELAGVGVAYKLVCALSEIYPAIDPENYLDLVAIGTISDIVPLLDENRYLVRKGLAAINRRQRQCLVSLAGAAGLDKEKLNSSDISYQIAPRINASSRLEAESADTPLELLLSSDRAACGLLAQKLEIHNEKRKKLSRSLEESLKGELSSLASDHLLLYAFDPGIHLGVAGIAAGHFARRHYLPVIIGQIADGLVTASCRSIPEFNIIQALDSCGGLFIRYGGHSLAAGFTLDEENLPAMLSCLEEKARGALSHLDLRPKLALDAEITLDQISMDLLRELDQLEPCGSKNPQAVFVTRGLSSLRTRRVGRSGAHLKFTVTDGEISVEAIGFNLGELQGQLGPQFDLAYHLGINEYRGNKEIQLQVLDFRPV